jgi:hypothetical protein
LVGVGVVIFCFPPCSFFFFLEFTFGLSSMWDLGPVFDDFLAVSLGSRYYKLQT